MEVFEAELARLHLIVTLPVRKTIDLLLLGDCYWLDVVTFLGGAMRQDGFGLNPLFIGSYNPAEVLERLQENSSRTWTAVLYSPFSYTFSPDLSRSLKPSLANLGTGNVGALVGPAMEVIGGCLDLMARLFDCPIFVHNSVNIRRHNSTAADLLKHCFSADPPGRQG